MSLDPASQIGRKQGNTGFHCRQDHIRTQAKQVGMVLIRRDVGSVDHRLENGQDKGRPAVCSMFQWNKQEDAACANLHPADRPT